MNLAGDGFTLLAMGLALAALAFALRELNVRAKALMNAPTTPADRAVSVPNPNPVPDDEEAAVVAAVTAALLHHRANTEPPALPRRT